MSAMVGDDYTVNAGPVASDGEDLVGAVESIQQVGRWSATQWAWAYVVGGLILLWLMGKFVWSGR